MNKSKNLFKKLTSNFCWLSTVKNFFRRNSWTYDTPCHSIGHFVFLVSPCYLQDSMPCQWSSLIYHECHEFEKAFCTPKRFLPCTSSCWAQAFPGSRQFNLKVSRISCWSSKHSPEPTIRLNHNNPQKRYGGRLCLRVMKFGLVWYVWSANKESASYGIRTLYTIGEHVISLMLSFRPQSHTVYDKLKV